ncbi:hypothetical protein [Alteromonas sp. A079]|uniref:hypothetical protein n=1 Tax=Alteromonas sp. A079 TaxID=3410268 RepID=UPI003B9E1FC5
MMKTKLTAIAALLLTVSACDVNKTESGDLPDVDVDVSADAGELPEYEVNWADIDVGTTTEMVSVPKVVIVTEEEEVEVPFIDINMPGDKYEDRQKVRKTIVVEAEVEERVYDINIERVMAKGERLIVVSTLAPSDKMLGDERVRVSDRIVLNAPDLDVRHFIIGDKPAGDWNNQYVFVGSENELSTYTDGSVEIYKR